MNKKITFVLLAMLASIASCNKNNNSTNDETLSSENLVDVITNDNYYWAINEDNAYNNDFIFAASTNEKKSSLKVYVDENEIFEGTNHEVLGKIKYNLNPDAPCHSDSVEHAYNKITLNGLELGKLPSDDSLGIDLYNNLQYIRETNNVFSVTIGAVYRNEVSYNRNEVHGGSYDVLGTFDDFQISNFRVELQNGQIIKPSKMVIYKPANVTTNKYNTYEISQEDDKWYWLGDGWGKTESTLSYDNNPNPRLDIPFQIDYYFDYPNYEVNNNYYIDTTAFDNGRHYITLKDNDKVVLQNNIYFDNVSPVIKTNLNEFATINKNFNLNVNINDEHSKLGSKAIYLDGKLLNDDYSFTTLNNGKHSLLVYANDIANNVTFLNRVFNVMDSANGIDITLNKDKNKLSFELNDYKENTTYNSSVYKVNKLNSNIKKDTANLIDEFEVTVNDINKPLYVTYDGTTLNGEQIAISALNNKTSKYEQVAIKASDTPLKFTLNPTNYVVNNKITFKATPLYVGNGSNRILWASDTQYLPKVEFSDINYMYNDLMTYVSNEYKNNKMAYLIHTGDIVDNNPSYKDGAIAEWKNATKAFEILDNNEVPYGVCAGNHDVGSSLASIDYNYYSTYFGFNRFNDKAYYGGSLNDNECHYDLISVGDYDFVVLYIGFGVEAKKETITWANEVLKTYKHRNAIVATHGYLDYDGTIDKTIQGQYIYDEIVKPNENVKFVFCGHTDGNACTKKVLDNNRVVYEVLNCYQFVEKESYRLSHLINGLTCNGEGYIREVIFDNNKVKFHTFSPITNKTNPLNAKDDFEVEIDLIKRNKEFISNSFEAYQIDGNEIASTNDISLNSIKIDNNSNYIVLTSINSSFVGFNII